MPEEKPAPLVFAACDDRYFHRFAIPLVRSIEANAPGHDVHLHVMAPLEKFAREADALSSSLAATDLTLTWETPPPGAR